MGWFWGIAQWHQWLRHTRQEAPSVQEQQYEVSRRAMVKQLAEQADERWRSVPSFLDSPKQQQPAPAIGISESQGPAEQAAHREVGEGDVVRSAVGDQSEVAGVSERQGQDVGREKRSKRERKENPWQSAQRGAPSEKWQPETWSPGVAQRRG